MYRSSLTDGGRVTIPDAQAAAIQQIVRPRINPNLPKKRAHLFAARSKLPTLRLARAAPRSAISAWRFWLTLSVMRRSSMKGAETRFASSNSFGRFGHRALREIRDFVRLQMAATRRPTDRYAALLKRHAQCLRRVTEPDPPR